MRITIRQIAEAMQRDKTPKTTGELLANYSGYNDPIELAGGFTHSCAIGGAAFVLGVNAEDLQAKLTYVDRDGVPMPRDKGSDEPDIASAIWRRNDDTTYTKRAIGNLILAKADEKTLNTVVNVKKETRKAFLNWIKGEK